MALEMNSLVEEIVAFKTAGGSVKELFQPASDKAPENMSYLELLGAACSVLGKSRTLEMEYNGNIPARRAAAGLQDMIESAEYFPPSSAKSILPGMLTGNLANFNDVVGRFFADSEAVGALKKLNERDRKVVSLFAMRAMDMEPDLGVSKYAKDTLDAQQKQRETEAAQKAEAERLERERQEQLERERQRKEEEARQREKEKQEREERERLEKEKIAKQKREIENLKEALRQEHSGYVNNLEQITETAKKSASTTQKSIEKIKREIEEAEKLLEKETEELERRKAETEYQEEKKKEEKKEEKKKEKTAAPKKKDEPRTIKEAEYLATVRKAFIAEHEEEKRQAERENEEALKAKEKLEQEEARLNKEKRALEKKREDLANELKKVEAAWNKKQEPIIREKERKEREKEKLIAEAREKEKRIAEEREKEKRIAEEREEAERRQREEAERRAAEEARIAEIVKEDQRKTREAEAAAEAMREKDLPAGDERVAEQTLIDNRPLRHYYYHAMGAALSQFGLSADEVKKSVDVRLFGKRSTELTNVTNLVCLVRKQLEGDGNFSGVAGTMKGMKDYCIQYLNKYPKVRSTQSGRDSYDAMLSLLAICANPGDPEVKACIDGINQKRGVAGRRHAKDFIDLSAYGPDRLLGRKKGAVDLLKETDKALVEKAKLAKQGDPVATAEVKRLQLRKLYLKASTAPNGVAYPEELDATVTKLAANAELNKALAAAAKDPKMQDKIMAAEYNKLAGRRERNEFYEKAPEAPQAQSGDAQKNKEPSARERLGEYFNI